MVIKIERLAKMVQEQALVNRCDYESAWYYYINKKIRDAHNFEDVKKIIENKTRKN